ncbi:MAG: glycosyltransferase family 2 protein, partial [Planctomycetota bacterium]
MTSRPAPRSLSVLMPTWQGIEFLDRVVEGLRAQRCPVPWDVLVIDSGSSDGTVERLREHAQDFPVPLRVEGIPSFEFDHGDTRNLLAARSEGELLVYLTQDAIPSRPDWLERLLANFDDPRVGAVTCGNVARPDALPSTRVLSRDDPGYARERRVVRLPEREAYDAMSPMERRLFYAFQNVAAAVRRDLWERFPFPRTMMGEDVLMARGLVEAGFDLVLDPDASVDHSHDYPPEKLRWRGEVDGRFNAEWLDWVGVGARADVPVLAERLVRDDLASIVDPDERAALEPELRRLRAAFVEGVFEGGASLKRYARSSWLPSQHLSVLDLLPELPVELPAGVPPGQPGGQAPPIRLRHALATSAALLDRGHAVVVAAPAPDGPAGSVRDGQSRGLRTALVRDLDGWRRLLAESRAQVLRVPVLWEEAAPWIQAAIEARVGVVVTVDDPADLGDEESELSVAVAAADRLVATCPEVHEALRARRLVDTDWLVHARRGVDAPEDGPLPRVAAAAGSPVPVAVVGGDPVALELEGTRRGTPVVVLDGLEPRERAEALAGCPVVAVLSTSPGEGELWSDEARFQGAAAFDRARLASAGVDPDDARAVLDALAA